MSSHAPRDAVYARISQDDTGTEKGVQRQLEDCRALSLARGGQVVAEYSDNDISATNGDYRPRYEALMEAVAAGEVDRILAYQTSRLWRNRRERAGAMEVLREAGVSVLTVRGPELDMSSASGRMMAGIIGEFDTAESEIKGERIARAALQRAQEGRANAAAAYGWRREYVRDERGHVTGSRDVEDPTTAPIVREIVARILAGETMRGITADLNARGVPAPKAGERRASRARMQDAEGTKWGHTSVKKIAVRPANVGLRLHHRGRPDEVLLPAAWPAIVEADDHDRVVALLAGNSGPKVARPGARVHLLSCGIGECGVCHGDLMVSLKGNIRYGTKRLTYVCAGAGCVGRNEARVDAHVRGAIIRRLAQPDLTMVLEGDNSEQVRLLAEAEALRARLAKMGDDYADGLLTAEQLHRATARVRGQLVEIERRAGQGRRSPHIRLVLELAAAGDEAATQAKWEALTVAQKRAVVAALIESVEILKVARRGPGFDPRSVRINWRGVADPVSDPSPAP